MAYFNINRVVIVARLTRDPELRALPSGVNVCGLRVACNSARRDPAGDLAERPNFFDVSVYGAPADNVANYLRKGARVAIDGRLEWREWETSEHGRRQAVSIVADTVQFLDSPGSGRPRDGLGEDDGEDSQANERDDELVGVGAGDDAF